MKKLYREVRELIGDDVRPLEARLIAGLVVAIRILTVAAGVMLILWIAGIVLYLTLLLISSIT